MSKVLFIYEQDMPTVSITREMFRDLAKRWDVQPSFAYLGDVTKRDVEDHDVLFLLRPNNILAWKIAQRAREAGRFVIFFTDDDLLDLPDHLPTIPWRRRGLIKALRNSDAVCSSSQYILDRYVGETAQKRKARTDTVVSGEEIRAAREAKRPDRERVHIVYAAGAGHVKLFDSFVRPALPQLIKQYGDSIALYFVGVQPDLSEYKENIPVTYVKGMPLVDYRRYMYEQQFDIGLAPLADDSFSKCKYFNKFLEYTLQGAVGVYSNVEPYTYVVENGENGFLADNTPESWLNALGRAIGDVQIRKQCQENALKLLEESFSEKQIAEKLFEALPEMLRYDKQKSPCRSFFLPRFVYLLSRPLDWLYLSVFYMKRAGWSGFLKKLKSHFQDGKAYKRTRK